MDLILWSQPDGTMSWPAPLPCPRPWPVLSMACPVPALSCPEPELQPTPAVVCPELSGFGSRCLWQRQLGHEGPQDAVRPATRAHARLLTEPTVLLTF